MGANGTAGPRERLLEAGQELTYRHGVNVGVDALLTAASQLHLLIDGALAAGATRPETHPAAEARELAEHILGAQP